jgi:hypothetical protein
MAILPGGACARFRFRVCALGDKALGVQGL